MHSSVKATLAVLLAVGGGRAGGADLPHDPQAVYAQLCANCHGEGLNGGKGNNLLADHLKYGADDEALARAVRDGYPATGMPAFGASMDGPAIRALVVFLRERRANAPTPTRNDAIDQHQVRQSERHPYRIEVVVGAGLEVPWSFVFLPDGRILLTERAGRLRIIDHGRLLPDPVAGVPAVVEQGEGGLLAVALHPDFARNGWVYLAFSDPGAGDTAMTKIVRGRLTENGLVELTTIFSIPREKYPHGYMSFGCRLLFDGDYLFFSVGERAVLGDAQKLEVPNGKIHRVFADGTVPPDNPFAGTPGAFGSIWSYGHRNPQGLAMDRRSHALWETEHGPRGGDELNFIEPGKNYGWPVITYGINYDGTAVTDRTAAPGMEQPVKFWTPSIATSQISFYTGDRFPQWKNNLFLGSLAQQRFIRFEISGRTIVHEEEIFRNLGRIRDIVTGPDGLLYVALEQLGGASGQIVRLVPADAPGS